jgi:hypothetical protein
VELIRGRPFVCRAGSRNKESESLLANVLEGLSPREALMEAHGRKGTLSHRIGASN